MDDIWSILEIEATRDTAAIKSAYARMAAQYHPEEQPELFLRLRQAYQAALAYANAPARQDKPRQAKGEGESNRPQDQSAPPPERSPAWRFDLGEEEEEDAFRDGEAHRAFLDLYCGKSRRDKAKWLDYFTSGAFLDVFRQKGFTGLLRREAERLAADYPPSKEFLTGLYIAYLFNAQEVEHYDLSDAREGGPDQVERQFFIYPDAAFDGIEDIFALSRLGPIPRKFIGNDAALLAGFMDYRQLTKLAEAGVWDDNAMAVLRHVLGRYVMAYMKDRCTASTPVDTERHPLCVRLLDHFFTKYELPREVYDILWKRLDLKSAQYGRSRVLYGRLRELVLERSAATAEAKEEKFTQVHRAFMAAPLDLKKGPDPDYSAEEAATEALFAREDFQRALRDREMVEENVLTLWTAEHRAPCFLRRILAFYRDHPDAPRAEKVIQRVEQVLAQQRRERQDQEDDTAGVPETLTLACRPFLRYWLNVGFYDAQDLETGEKLAAYLQEELPYSLAWARRFIGVEEGQTGTRSVMAAGVRVDFHLFHISYAQYGLPRYEPFFPWDRLCQLAEGTELLLLLPMAIADQQDFRWIRADLQRRLEAEGVPGDLGRLAGFLAGRVCGGAARPWEVCRETPERLFGCEWFLEEKTLYFFEQTQQGRVYPQGGRYDLVMTEGEAIELAQRLLRERISPTEVHVRWLGALPDLVEISPIGGPREVLTGEEISWELLERELDAFAHDQTRRLELSWETRTKPGETEDYPPHRSLVLLQDRPPMARQAQGYACLFFDDQRGEWFALLYRPDVYQIVDCKDVQYHTFCRSRLPSYCIHPDWSTIRMRLDQVFKQLSCRTPLQTRVDGAFLWSVSVTLGGRQKYNVIKQQLALFPPERSSNRLNARFGFGFYPSEVVLEDLAGGAERWAIGDTQRDRAQQALTRFMSGRLRRLRLTWTFTERGEPRRSHIVLLQDQGRYVMAYLQEEKRSVEFYTGNVRAYLKAEGKVKQEPFLQWRLPFYLVHDDLKRIRNGLDLMLDTMPDPSLVTGNFGEFAYGIPLRKPPAFEVFQAQLLGEEPV